MAVYWRRSWLMRFLRRTLLLPWAVPSPLVVHLILSRSFRWGVEGLVLHLAEELCVCAAVVTFLLYLCAAFRAFWCPDRAGRSGHRMVWLFPLAFLITVAPVVYLMLAGINDTTTPHFLAEVVAALAGLANVAARTCHLSLGSSPGRRDWCCLWFFAVVWQTGCACGLLGGRGEHLRRSGSE